MVVRGADRAAFLLCLKHLEIIHDIVGDGLAAVSQVSVLDGERFAVQGGFLPLRIAHERGRQFLEDIVLGIRVRNILDDVARTHVLEYLIRIPGPFNHIIPIVLEPTDERFRMFRQLRVGLRGEIDKFQALHRHEGQPGVRVLFHNRGTLGVMTSI